MSRMIAMKTLVTLFAATCVMLPLNSVASGTDVAEQMKPLIDSNTVGFMHIDVERTKSSQVQEIVRGVIEIGMSAGLSGDRFRDVRGFMPTFLENYQTLKEAGATDLFLCFNITRPQFNGLLVPAPSEDIAKQWQSAVSLPAQVVHNALYFGSADSETYAASLLCGRDDVSELLALTEGHFATCIIAPTADHRRAIREVMPELPAPFDSVNGEFVADAFELISLTCDSTSPIDMNLTIKSADRTSSQQLWIEGQKTISMLAGNESPLPPNFQAMVGLVGQSFTAVQENEQIDLRIQQEQLAEVAEASTGLVEQLNADTARTQVMNQVRQIAIAFHNYSDTTGGRLPGYASFDEDGNPLLSWRVHALQFTEHIGLYDKFHLDEPWDSEHNIKLVSEMPAIYDVPIGFLNEDTAAILRADGKTTFVMPRGEEVMGTAEGLRFRDITDGTSGTIMILTAPPESAVVWTKPDDLEINLDDPSGTVLGNRSTFISAFGDGSSHVFTNKIKKETLRALLTYKGGEVVEY